MKAKTREKLAARGLGPLVRPGRPGRGRRGALAPQRGAGVRDAVGAGAVGEGRSPVCEVPGYGEVLPPFAGSVRERVRLRPAVRDALDAEAVRLGMTREGLCRVVLEEVARNVGGASALAVEDSGPVPAIPAAYVGGADPELDTGCPGRADPEDAVRVGGAQVVGEPGAGAHRLGERALLSAGSGSAADAAPVRRVRRVRRLRGLRRIPRVRASWAAALAVVLLAVLSLAAAAVSSRYEVALSAGDGVYVVDRWQGSMWRCGLASGGRPPVCAQAVFRQPVGGADVAYLGRPGG